MGTAVLALASLATTAVSTGISFYGAKQQAKSQKYAAEYNAKVAENEARNVQLQSTEQQKRMRQQNRREMAELRNHVAGGGTLTTSGTTVDLLAENAANLDTQVQDAARQARLQADSLYAQAELSRWEGRQAVQAGKVSAYGALFSGVSNMASTYYGFHQKGTLAGAGSATRAAPAATRVKGY